MKYKLTENTFELRGKTYYQIEALKDFGDVKAGALGGWIESEQNLSQEGTCWIHREVWVSGDIRISGDGRINNNVKYCIHL